MELVRDQMMECGIELTIVDEGFISLSVLTHPHIAPNDEGQVDAYFGGWSTNPEPNPFLIFHSSQCATADEPRLFNYICFDNPEADALIEQGRRVSDLNERARIYRGLERVLHDEQPYLFA